VRALSRIVTTYGTATIRQSHTHHEGASVSSTPVPKAVSEAWRGALGATVADRWRRDQSQTARRSSHCPAQMVAFVMLPPPSGQRTVAMRSVGTTVAARPQVHPMGTAPRLGRMADVTSIPTATHATRLAARVASAIGDGATPMANTRTWGDSTSAPSRNWR
jgi:hypothetical protein